MHILATAPSITTTAFVWNDNSFKRSSFASVKWPMVRAAEIADLERKCGYREKEKGRAIGRETEGKKGSDNGRGRGRK